MPEGVEVRLLGEEIADLITGSKLTSVKVISGRYKSSKPTGMNLLLDSLPMSVRSVGVTGKFMWWELLDKEPLFAMFTLGMSGGWSLIKSPYARVEFVFHKSGHLISLYMLDVRNFGTIKFANKSVFSIKLSALGTDMFSRSWTSVLFGRDLSNYARAHPQISIADALICQKVVSGPGAYIITEALYASEISPSRRVKNMSARDVKKLHAAIRSVVKLSYSSNKDCVSIYKLTRDIKDVSQYNFAIYDKKDLPSSTFKIYKCGDRHIRWVPSVQK